MTNTSQNNVAYQLGTQLICVTTATAHLNALHAPKADHTIAARTVIWCSCDLSDLHEIEGTYEMFATWQLFI